MAWNEPGGNNKEPWGGGNRGGGNDGPPDLDEALKNLQKKLSGIFGGNSGGSTGGSSPSGSSSWLFGLVAVAVTVAYIIAGADTVNEQERAVVLRLGVYHETKGPGFRWNPPLIDTVYTKNVTKLQTWTASEQMLTKDLNIVDVKLSVQFAVDDARDFVLNVREPEISLQQAANSALRHVAGSTLMHGILTEERQEVAAQIQQ